MASAAEVESYLRSGIGLSAHEQQVLAQALSERYADLAGPRRPLQRAEAHRPGGAPARSRPDGPVQLGLLGSFSLRVDAQPVGLAMSCQRLVSFLALHDGLLLREHVAGSLWGDTTERRALGSLRSALWRLGHAGHPLVEVVGSHLRLFENVQVDVRASEALARRVLDRSLVLSDADLDAALLSVDLLPDWTEDWVLVRRDHHTQLRLRALEALSMRLSEMGRFGQAVQAAMLAVSREPLRESAQRTLVTVHLAEGNVAAGLAQYATFEALLREELRLQPSAEMQRLVRGLTR
jgi:DNA-binding SARP family transcriptional activator